MKNWLYLINIFIIAFTSLQTVSADVPAFTLTNSGSHNNLSSNFVVGYDFTVLSPIEVTELGVFDHNHNGILDEPSAPIVTIWDSNEIELISTHVPLNTTVTEGVFYASVAPITLPPGTYTIGVLNYSQGERFVYDVTPNAASQVLYVQGRYLPSTSMAFPSNVATAVGYFGANFKYSSTLQLTAPKSPSILQQQGEMTALSIEGNADSGAYIQARASVLNGGQDLDWTDLGRATNGQFSNSIKLTPGWYQLEVRSLNQDGTVLSSQIIDKVGVGDIYLMAGQSNSANFGYPRQKPTDERVLNLSVDGLWQPANDPQPRANGANGSPWPAMGDLLSTRTNMPIGIISTGQGSTTVGQWMNGLYDTRLRPAILSLGQRGFKAILWHQGESDSIFNSPAQGYAASLMSVIDRSRQDAGFDVPWYIATASFHPQSSTAAQANIALGQALTVSNGTQVFQGSDTDNYHNIGYLNDSVHFNNEGLRDHGKQWADLLTASTINIATKGVANQSSTAFAGDASRANDGNSNGDYGQLSVSHTEYQEQPWWEVDLKSTQLIEEIKIHNRTNCCSDRLVNVNIFVSSLAFGNKTAAQLKADATVKHRYFAGSLSTISSWVQAQAGRYVRIQLEGFGYLSLAEVEVLVRPPTNTVAVGVASQSSTNFGGEADRANDGNTDGDYGQLTVSHTAYQEQPWWQLDMLSSKTIDEIRIYNRTNCCSDRLVNVNVFVSNIPFDNKTIAQLKSDPNTHHRYFSGVLSSLTSWLQVQTGRYVRVQLDGYGYLSLAEVEVFVK